MKKKYLMLTISVDNPDTQFMHFVNNIVDEGYNIHTIHPNGNSITYHFVLRENVVINDVGDEIHYKA